MIIFFDIGCEGAISIFKNKKLQQVISFNLKDWGPINLKNKLYNWKKLLEKFFTDLDAIEIVGCFEPFGRNRKTIAHLAMLISVIIIHFYSKKIFLINEWSVWKSVLKQNTIPLRAEKKQLTIEWAKKTFQLMGEIDDNQADAILGGYFLVQYN